MENMNPESLLRKAQALGDDIKEMESIDVMGAYRQTQATIKTNRRKGMYNQLMRYARCSSDIYILMERMRKNNT